MSSSNSIAIRSDLNTLWVLSKLIDAGIEDAAYCELSLDAAKVICVTAQDLLNRLTK